jgi:hypothetical protein
MTAVRPSRLERKKRENMLLLGLLYLYPVLVFILVCIAYNGNTITVLFLG